MNRKGITVTIGAIILTFVGVIFALAILTGGLTDPIAQVTQTFDVDNETHTFPENGTNLQLTGQAISNVEVTNASGGEVVPTSNYSIYNRLNVNGVLTAGITGDGSAYHGNSTNISFTYEPFGYDTNSGGRAIAGLIIIFAALAIAVFTLIPTLKSGVLEMLRK